MKTFVKSISLVLVIASLTGCSRKNNSFLNRNWHAMTARYNTLYNGNLALEQGREEMNANYFDNYWEVLPIERMEVLEPDLGEDLEPALGEGESEATAFEIAEQKAIKAIQKHSMMIDGRERNPQIDEAYLLLGKARYYDQRFVAALEAFNFILQRYPLSDNIYQARIWREKTNLRLEFEELAISNLKALLELEFLEEQERADAAATLAQAYINLSHLDSALVPLRNAARLTRNRDERGRYFFIQGQLYERLGKADSAGLAFEQVVEMNRKIPRVYLVNAQLAKTRILGQEPEEREEAVAQLTEMLEVRENRPFLNRIYFERAEVFRQRDSVALAVQDYNNSLDASSGDVYLRSLNYEQLGNLYFDRADYSLAGAYYDSTLSLLAENSREFRSVRRKRDNLEDVIYYESVAQANDSILYLARLPEEERLEYFSEYTRRLKEEALTAREEGDATATVPLGSQRNPGPPGIPNPGSSFYFYNPSTVSYGRQEFLRLWGDRPLTDNWRTGAGAVGQWTEGDPEQEEALALEENPLFDPYTYLESLPQEPEVLDSLKQQRDLAYYQLGLIYRNKFGELPLAAEHLEELLATQPQERLILPAKYNLYRIYQEMGEEVRALALKNDILHQYPNSRYAGVIQNPEAAMSMENDPQTLYKDLYARFEAQEYEEVIAEAEELVRRHLGDPMVPKFQLLKARAVGRLLGFEAYRQALNELALDHPQSEEGKHAQQLYSESLPQLEDDSFQPERPEDDYKMLFRFDKSEEEAISELRERIETYIRERNYGQLRVSRDVYNPQEVFVVVHGFDELGKARFFRNLLSNLKEFPIHKKSLYISTPNYRIVQIHKNLETYLTQ